MSLIQKLFYSLLQLACGIYVFAFLSFYHALSQPLDQVPFKTYIGNQDIPLNFFRAGLQDKYGFMWFGDAFDGSIARYDGYDWAFIYADPNKQNKISHNHILEMKFSSTGLLFVTTMDGLNVIDPSKMDIRIFRNHPNDIKSLPAGLLQDIFEVSEHIFWISSPNGISELNLRTEECRHIKILPERMGGYNGNFVTSIIADKFDQNVIWLCSDSGLHRYLRDQQKFFKISDPPNISLQQGQHFVLHEIFQENDSILWITRGREEGKIYSYNTKQNLWSDFPYNGPVVKFDTRSKLSFNGLQGGFGDTLYFSSVIGNGYFIKSTGEYVLFPYEQGSVNGHSAGWTAHIIPDRHGCLWYPGYTGISRSTRPLSEDSPISSPLQTHITAVSIDSNEYYFPPFPTIAFKSLQNYLSIKFAIPIPQIPSLVKYEYLLEGFDKEWTITEGSNKASYHNLPGGQYTFRVRGNEGNGWTRESNLEVNVMIPFWQTKSFPFLLVGCVISMFGLGYFINDRTRAVKEKKLRQKFIQQVDEIQMTALRAQMNPHFLFNSLNSIKYYAISKSKEETADYLSKFSLLVRTILNNSKSRTISLKDELDALILYIEIEHLRLEGTFEYELVIDEILHLEEVQIPPMILQPYVENAIWHGLMHKLSKGKLLIQVKCLGHQIQCLIEDNGVGRNHSKKIESTLQQHKNSMGMKITSDRIDLINKIYNIDTHVYIVDLEDPQGLAIGTRVIINIPNIHLF